ncbi:MAG: hypothetical protein E7Z86_00175 [Methanosphaera stadtmanae]|jgi:hypothetical protein|nr:hypothetical protein [Methanosphaera stadtmanae]
MDDECYFTISGVNHYHGIKPFKIGKILKLIKEPDNDYDQEAIKVQMRYAGDVGYVSNSVKTVAKGTMSAGRLYDKILDEDYAIVKFAIDDYVIAKTLSQKELDEQKDNPDSDINYI